MIGVVSLPGTQLTVSRLGMGCASLGSRYGAGAGVRALARASDMGITWFDLAPAYGAGEAEVIFGRFAKGRRQSLHICTKVGALPPPSGGLRRLLMPLARPVVARLKGARRAIRNSGATANTHFDVTGERIEASIVRSLSRLGTDYVDVFALHMPAPDALLRDDVLRALEDVIRRGQARQVAVAGTLEAALAGAASGHYGVVQLADDPTGEPLAQVRAAAAGPLALVSHSILGAGGTRELLMARLALRPALLDEARAAGFGVGEADDAIAGRLLMARALASNRDGVVLASMFGAGHLEANIAAAGLQSDVAYDLVQRALLD